MASAWARQRMPLPLISAIEPSALTRRHDQVGAGRCRGGPTSRPSAPDAVVAVAPPLGALDPRRAVARHRASSVRRTRKSLPRPWCLVRRNVMRPTSLAAPPPIADPDSPAHRRTSCGIGPDPSQIAHEVREGSGGQSQRSAAAGDHVGGPGRRVVVGVEPGDAGVAAEPGPLAAGEGAGAADGLVEGVVERRSPVAAAAPPRGRAARGSRGPGRRCG